MFPQSETAVFYLFRPGNGIATLLVLFVWTAKSLTRARINFLCGKLKLLAFRNAQKQNSVFSKYDA